MTHEPSPDATSEGSRTHDVTGLDVALGVHSS